MKRAIPLFVLLILATIILIRWSYREREETTISSSKKRETAPATASPAAGAKVAAPSIQTPLEEVSPRFRQFLEEESRSLNSRNVDLSQAEEKVRTQASQLSEADIRYARDLAISPNSPANQRLLAAYLLSKSDARSWSAMEDLILAPTSSARAEPHSEEELKNVQAKSIALMEVDGLAEQAARVPAARDRLLRLATSVKDSTIQKYIQQRIRELPPL